MKKSSLFVILSCGVLGVAACGKKAHQTPDSTSVPPAVTNSAAPAPPAAADQTEAQAEHARKVALLDYGTMEDTYINDPRAQWASAAKASSSFGQSSNNISEVNAAANMVGPVDGRAWTNDSQNIGFDWVEATFAKPVHATEIRVVFADGAGVEAVNKLEVQGEDGHWTTVWSGLSDVKKDARGARTWFVRTFDKTASAVKTVKMTIANNVQTGYKVVDAIQLVGD